MNPRLFDMPSVPLISIIIPTYNRITALPRAIESVLNQTYSNFELIVIDDGSDDHTDTYVHSLLDSRISYFYIQNQGVANARNVGVEKSSGDLIAFLDSDDEWLSEKLEKQVQYMADYSRACICQTEEIWIRNNKRVNAKKKHVKQSGWIFLKCVPLCIVSPSAVMMTRSTFCELGGFDNTFLACEDYELWLRAALRYPILTMPDALIIKYGGHADQLSKQSKLDRYRINALQKILLDSKCNISYHAMIKQQIVARAEIVRKGASKRNNRVLTHEMIEIQNKMRSA